MTPQPDQTDERLTREVERVLIVDDEPDLSESVKWRLERDGFDVSSVADGTAALEAAERLRPDLVLLDLVLPRMSGMDVLRELRAAHGEIPVILISGHSEEVDRIAAFEIGAEDFVVKPFSPRELVARIRSAIRRSKLYEQPAGREVIEVGDIVIEVLARRVQRGGETVRLSTKEFELLVALARSPDRAITKTELVAQVWRDTTAARPEATLTEHISRLRRKLEDAPSVPTRLVTVHGVGYCLRA